MKRQGIKYLMEQEKQTLLKALKNRKDAERAYMMYDLMLNTGLRLSETVALNVGDIQGRTLLEVKGKGSKIREVPLNKALRAHIEVFLRWKSRHGEAIKTDAPLFISKKKLRISKRAVERDLERWVKEAGLEGHYTPHALRHTVGTELLNKTGNLRLVQTFLGHSDISTTQIYTHINKEQVMQASELLST
jgi:site-specific recombinase XerD